MGHTCTGKTYRAHLSKPSVYFNECVPYIYNHGVCLTPVTCAIYRRTTTFCERLFHKMCHIVAFCRIVIAYTDIVLAVVTPDFVYVSLHHTLGIPLFRGI